MKTSVAALLICALSLAAASSCREKSGVLTVSAAISLKDAFTEMATVYKSRTGREVDLNYGASGALEKQIETGAPADLFASAGEEQMQDLVDKALVNTSNVRNFARNTLVVIVPAASRLQFSSFDDLAGNDLKKIAVGNPRTVPAGRYAQQSLERSGLADKVQGRLITADDVRQVLEYVVRGEVDAGIVYATDARSAGESVKVASSVKEELHDPILYPIAVVRDAANERAAREFADLVLGADGQAILQKYGFAPANR